VEQAVRSRRRRRNRSIPRAYKSPLPSGEGRGEGIEKLGFKP